MTSASVPSSKRRAKAAPSLGLVVTLALATLSIAFFAACGEEGVTPNCPAVPLYDIGAAGERNAAEDERQKAVDAGCMTDIDKTDAGSTP